MSIHAEIFSGCFSMDTVTSVRGEAHQTLEIPFFTADLRFRIEVDKAETLLLKGLCYKYIQEKFSGWVLMVPDITLAHATHDLAFMGALEAQDSMFGPKVPEENFMWDYADHDHRCYDEKYFPVVFTEVNFLRRTDGAEDPDQVDWLTKVTFFRDNGMVVVTPGLVKEGLKPVIMFSMPIKFALGHMSKRDAWQDDFKADVQPAVTEPA